MSNYYDTWFEALYQGLNLPVGLKYPLKEWLPKEIRGMRWNTTDWFDAIKKAFSTQDKALKAREFYRDSFARLAVYDGCVAVRMCVTYPDCKYQNKDEYNKQFEYFDRLDNDLTNSRVMRKQKPVLFKVYELTEIYNLHRHYVIFLKDEFLAIQTFCELVARIIKLLDSGGVQIELPEEYKDPLVRKGCIKPFDINSWVWSDQQKLKKGRKLTIAFKEVYDKEEDAMQAMRYAAKGERRRKLPLSIGDDDSLKDYRSDLHHSIKEYKK